MCVCVCVCVIANNATETKQIMNANYMHIRVYYAKVISKQICEIKKRKNQSFRNSEQLASCAKGAIKKPKARTRANWRGFGEGNA